MHCLIHHGLIQHSQGFILIVPQLLGITSVTIETMVRTFSFSAEPLAFGSNSRLKHTQGQASSSADDGWSNFGTEKVPSINTRSQTYPFSMQTITVLLHMHANSSSWGQVSMEPKRLTAH